MPYETDGMRDHTGSAPAEALRLKQFQEQVLPKWYPPIRPTGLYDNPTKLAVFRIQHAMHLPQTGRLDEKVWDYAQENSP